MDTQTFDERVNARLTQCKEVLKAKGLYYTVNKDRLDQFKKGAVLQDTTPIGALGGMMVKHTTKLYDLIGAEERGEGPDIGSEEWDEVIVDHINYLLLLSGLLGE